MRRIIELETPPYNHMQFLKPDGTSIHAVCDSVCQNGGFIVLRHEVAMFGDGACFNELCPHNFHS